MGKKGNNKQHTTDCGKNISPWWFIPLFLLVAIVPMIAACHIYDTDLNKYSWFATDGVVYDYFLYYKSYVIRIIGAVVLILLAYFIPCKGREFLKDKRSIAPMTAMGLFGLMTLLSSFLSEHSDSAFWGGYEQFEGCFVILSYIVCFFMAFGYVRTIRLVKVFLDVALVGAFLIGLMGALQLIGIYWNDFPLYDWILKYEMVHRPEFSTGVTINFWKGMSYATLYNPNYMGSYVAVTIPVVGYLTICGDGLKRKVFAGITTILLLISLYGCGSMSGVIGIATSVVICVILILPLMKKNLRRIAIGAGVVAMLGIGAILAMRGEFASVFGSGDAPQAITDMRTDDDSVVISLSNGKMIRATLDKDVIMAGDLWTNHGTIEELLTVTDVTGGADAGASTADGADSDADGGVKAGNRVALHVEDFSTATIADADYPTLKFSILPWTITADKSADGLEHTFDVFHIYDGDIYEWQFLDAGENGELMLYDPVYGKVDTFHDIEKTGFEGHYSFGSGRGYIWSHTLPLLSKCFVTGYGPDNFIYYYPNDDYVSRVYNSSGRDLTTRPHNMFLQIWVQEGLIALIAFIALYLIFMWQALRMCMKIGKARRTGEIEADKGESEALKDSSSESRNTTDVLPPRKLLGSLTIPGVVIAIAVAATGYMASGLVNDSIVCVAPVYWVLLGVGYAAEAAWRKDAKSHSGITS